MANDVLVSPLGRAPGAVSGVYFALAHQHEIGKVITVGTSNADVLKAANYYLAQLFAACGVAYTPIHIPATDLRGGSKEIMPYVAMVGQALEDAQRDAAESGGKVHVAVTGGRSGMGALAALATNLYGADFMWHLWVKQNIEEGGTVDKLTGLDDPEQMRVSRFLNPTVEPDACEVVRLPFLDLRPLHPVLWEYRRTGKLPDVVVNPLAALFNRSDIKRFADVFPAGLTFGAADEMMILKARYIQAKTPKEQHSILVELGELLQRYSVVDKDDRQPMIDLVISEASPEEWTKWAVKRARDRIGFWKWLSQNEKQMALSLSTATFLLTALELYLKACGLLP